MKFLLIEDNEGLSSFIRQQLADEGHELDVAATGDDGLRRAEQASYDALIVDRMLPGSIDGLGVVQRLRAAGRSTPILILSALADVDERIRGLRAGGDDYLTKPFAFGELMARLEVLVRRQPGGPPKGELEVGDLRLDTVAHRVSRAGQAIALTAREFRLLSYLMTHAHQVVTRTMLLENVWEYDFDPETNVIDVQISKLRQKIDAGFDRPLLKTIRAVGYKITDHD